VYASHFGLTERPFSLAPDPRYLFLSAGHREALAHLLYGIGEGGGFVQLTGEVGTGKTTVCRALLDQLPPEVDVAMIFNPRLTSHELLATICEELHVGYPPGTKSLKALVDALSHALIEAHAHGRRTVLIIDEAQNLSMEVLEELRLLTNLETTEHKLLQVILIGQPELAAVLARPQLRQLAQRVTARYHLWPFSMRETYAYIHHRMKVAGQEKAIFTANAVRIAHQRAGGVPRLINSICDRALLGAFSKNRSRVSARIVRRAATEVLGQPSLRRRRWIPAAVAAALFVAITAGAAALGTVRLAQLAGAWRTTEPAPAVTARVSDVVATAAVTPPPPAPKPNLGAILGASATAGDKAPAFATLYGLWGVDSPGKAGVLGCESGRPAGFRCLWRRGTWTVLRRLDVPAVLTLATPSGDKHFAVLTALDEQNATVAIGERIVTLPLADVERFWDGEFVTTWKAPAIPATPLRVGTGGTGVRWLRQRLGGGEDPGTNLVYDEELRRRVVAFQQANGLAPDGIAGEETLLRLATTAPGSGAPSLATPRS
jgi:general secretion pathway protein A